MQQLPKKQLRFVIFSLSQKGCFLENNRSNQFDKILHIYTLTDFPIHVKMIFAAAKIIFYKGEFGIWITETVQKKS